MSELDAYIKNLNMNYLRLKNYRCFEDTRDIPIKPLNLLVGSNSSGKSSFLKFFPLLKQSVNTRRRGIFLWTGHYVDFKDFKNTINNTLEHDVPARMEISFGFENLKAVRRMRVRDDIIKKIDISLTLQQEDEHNDQLIYLKITFPEQKIICTFDNTRNKVVIEIGGITSESIKDSVTYDMTNALLPRLTFARGSRIGEDSSACIERINSIAQKYGVTNYRFTRYWYPLYANITPTKENTINIINKIWKVDISEEDINEIFSLQYYYNLNNIIDTININLLQFADNITYIGPLRKATERYYRFQNLAVDEIEPDGSNLAMYLYNLSQEELHDLNRWISSIFEFTVQVESDGGHVELNIEEKGKNETNLVDVGFGYTQVLPILVNIWKNLRRKLPLIDNGNREYIIAIEQPELHLHPRMQAKFGIMLANVINEAQAVNKDIRFIIETHSETLLNKIGELIAFDKIKNEDVNVVLFNAKHEEMDKEIEISKYSKDGFLVNWPIGFFS